MLSILDSLVETLGSYMLMGVFQSIASIIFKEKPHRIPSLPISQDPPSSHLTGFPPLPLECSIGGWLNHQAQKSLVTLRDLTGFELVIRFTTRIYKLQEVNWIAERRAML